MIIDGGVNRLARLILAVALEHQLDARAEDIRERSEGRLDRLESMRHQSCELTLAQRLVAVAIDRDFRCNRAFAHECREERGKQGDARAHCLIFPIRAGRFD